MYGGMRDRFEFRILPASLLAPYDLVTDTNHVSELMYPSFKNKVQWLL